MNSRMRARAEVIAKDLPREDIWKFFYGRRDIPSAKKLFEYELKKSELMQEAFGSGLTTTVDRHDRIPSAPRS